MLYSGAAVLAQEAVAELAEQLAGEQEGPWGSEVCASCPDLPPALPGRAAAEVRGHGAGSWQRQQYQFLEQAQKFGRALRFVFMKSMCFTQEGAGRCEKGCRGSGLAQGEVLISSVPSWSMALPAALSQEPDDPLNATGHRATQKSAGDSGHSVGETKPGRSREE